jgi:hypothetical protein
MGWNTAKARWGGERRDVHVSQTSVRHVPQTCDTCPKQACDTCPKQACDTCLRQFETCIWFCRVGEVQNTLFNTTREKQMAASVQSVCTSHEHTNTVWKSITTVPNDVCTYRRQSGTWERRDA